jgi:hypothetical protein
MAGPKAELLTEQMMKMAAEISSRKMIATLTRSTSCRRA